MFLLLCPNTYTISFRIFFKKLFFKNNLNNSLFCIRLNDFCENRVWGYVGKFSFHVKWPRKVETIFKWTFFSELN